MIPAETSAPPSPTAPPPRDNAGHKRSKLHDIKAFAQREPAQAVALAFGVGLLVNLLPTRVVAGTVSTVGAALLRPMLLSLGITKAIELTCNVTPLTPKP
jgi:hypothetical protein